MNLATRAFLFADLRDYTRFAEEHGAAAAADLLDRYRSVVRDAVARFAGAEIKTEGDSFYVVFGSASAAIGCALAIVEGGVTVSAQRPDAPIKVGIGIHAGETVEADGGFVGSPVNLAARLCSLAGPGEVLVSDTVRTLTQAVAPVTFEPLGRKSVKGLSEPIAVYSVAAVAEGSDAWQSGVRSRRARRARRRRILLGIAGFATVALAVGVASVVLRPAPSLPPGPWTIGVDLPLTGPIGDEVGRAIADAVKLAVDEANAAGDLAIDLQVDARDHGAPDPDPDAIDIDRATANINAFVADPRVIAVVGPVNSVIAREQIPVTNTAGLLQCSPATTNPGLTKPRDGALDLRAAAPDRINFVRTAPADDIQGKAAASFLFNDLDIRHLLVIEETEFDGAIPAGSVSEAFEKLGGRVTRRSLNPGAAVETVLDPLTSSTDSPTGVFYGGSDTDRAAEVRKAMTDSGPTDVPFVAWDWIGVDPQFIIDVGPGAVGAYVTHAAFAPPRSTFVDRYRAAYGREPGEFASAAYACVEIVLEALRAAAKTGPTPEGLREAVRASAVDPTHRYETVIGTIGFDANGDSVQQFVTLYRVDSSAANGKGEWVIAKQQDYGPAP